MWLPRSTHVRIVAGISTSERPHIFLSASDGTTDPLCFPFFIFNCAARFCENGSSRDAIISSSTSIIERSLPLCSTGRNISSCISTFFCFAESSLPPRMSPVHVFLLFGTISVPSSPDSSARYPTDFYAYGAAYILCRTGDIFLFDPFFFLHTLRLSLLFSRFRYLRGVPSVP